jgi:hypothetical protein
VTGYRQFLAWTKARAGRFVLIWGMLIFGGVTFVLSLVDAPIPVTPWFVAVSAVLHALAGLVWGWLMWFFLNWLQRRRKVQS